MQLVPKLDPLSIGEAEGHIVVKDGIHILDPEGVDRPIEHHPVHVGGGPAGLVEVGVVDLPDDRGGQSVHPLLRENIDLPIELAHADRFRVDDSELDRP
jgi:hypothetical protein